jgi:hypothetical protein
MSIHTPPPPLRLGPGRPRKPDSPPSKHVKKDKDPNKPPHPLDPTSSSGRSDRSFRIKTNPNAREAFQDAIRSGKTWDEAIDETGINPVEATQLLDNMMLHRRDGAAVYMLAERHLISAMSQLATLQVQAEDEKVRVVAASKLSDTAYRVLISKPYLDKVNQKIESQSSSKNIWDTEFSDAYSDNN